MGILNEYTYYEILGVEKNATPSDIKEAYRSCAKSYHPDSNAARNANFITAKIIEAYKILSDPIKRKAYDDSFVTCDSYEEQTGCSDQRESDSSDDVAASDDSFVSEDVRLHSQSRITVATKIFFTVPYYILLFGAKIIALPILLYMVIAAPIFFLAGSVVSTIAIIISIPLSVGILRMHYNFFTVGSVMGGEPIVMEHLYITQEMLDVASSSFEIWIVTILANIFNWLGGEGILLVMVTILYLLFLGVVIFLVFAPDVWTYGLTRLAGFVFKKWNRPNILQ